MQLVSIDPNVKRMALAVWEDGVLQSTLYLRSDLKGCQHTFDLLHELVLDPDEIAIEMMQIYRGGEQKKAALLKLNFYGGFAAGALYRDGTDVTGYLPRQWKGSVPKDKMLPRIMGKLTPVELQNVTLPTGKSYQHDVWDAVGVGLHHLGRLR